MTIQCPLIDNSSDKSLDNSLGNMHTSGLLIQYFKIRAERLTFTGILRVMKEQTSREAACQSHLYMHEQVKEKKG